MIFFKNVDDVKETCFLCGGNLIGAENNLEHIFPKWILKRYNVLTTPAQFLSANNSQENYNFARHTLSVHKDCNDDYGECLETPMSKGCYTVDQIWFWAHKIFCGLLFSVAIKQSYMKDLVRPLFVGRFDNYYSNLWGNKDDILSTGTATYFRGGTIIELDYLFQGDQFYHHIDFELGVVWICFNNRSYLILLKDKLTPEDVKEFQNEWEKKKGEMKLDDNTEITFLYKAFVAETAIKSYFDHYSLSSFDGGPLLPDRFQCSVEQEADFYAGFGLKKSTNENGTPILKPKLAT